MIDMAKTDGVALPALMDYVTMVVLAQVDPRSDYSDQPTVLNLFNDPANTTGLTDWDRAYLQAMYTAEVDAASTRSQEAAVVQQLERERRLAAAADDGHD